eukprot:g2546.t1
MTRDDKVLPESGLLSDAWAELGLDPILLSAIQKCGFQFPLPIQSYCIPAAVKNRKDVLGAAQTGSGKTLAFGLPIFQRLIKEANKANSKPNPLPSKSPELESLSSEDLTEVVGLASDDVEDLSISNSEIARLDQELGEVFYGDLSKKSDPSTCLKALILTPTRELALQTCKQLQSIGTEAQIRIVPVIGGMAPQKQTRLLNYNPEIVVATPGRFLDLYRQGHPHLRDLSQLRFLVVDECDKMIRHGDFKDLQILLQCIPEYQLLEAPYDSKVPKKKQKKSAEYRIPPEQRKMQTLLFSATLTLPRSLHRRLRTSSFSSLNSAEGEDIDEMAVALDHLRFRGEPTVVDLTSKSKLAERIQEAYVLCPDESPESRLYSVLIRHPGRTLVFCNSIKTVRKLTELLQLLNIPVQPLHAAKQQSQRLKALDRFKRDTNSVLVATDVAARGLDIDQVRCVVHYNVPRAADLYIHRSGRTARVEADGLALSLVTPNEVLRFNALFKALDRAKPPEFPMDQSMMPECELRCKLVRRIRYINSKLASRQRDDEWNKQTSERLDTGTEEASAGSESETSDLVDEQLKDEKDELIVQLKTRLALPLDNKLSEKFFTGDGRRRKSPDSLNQKHLVETIRENVAKAARLVGKKAKKAKKSTPASKSIAPEKTDRFARHQQKLQQILDKKIQKKQKTKSLSYTKHRLVVIPPALGRDVQGPDALQVMRKHLQKRQSSKL